MGVIERLMPLWIVIILVLIIVVVVLVTLKRRKEVEEEIQLAKRIDSEEPCNDRDPMHGWICERDLHHFNKHLQTVNGVKHTW